MKQFFSYDACQRPSRKIVVKRDVGPVPVFLYCGKCEGCKEARREYLCETTATETLEAQGAGCSIWTFEGTFRSSDSGAEEARKMAFDHLTNAMKRLRKNGPTVQFRYVLGLQSLESGNLTVKCLILLYRGLLSRDRIKRGFEGPNGFGVLVSAEPFLGTPEEAAQYVTDDLSPVPYSFRHSLRWGVNNGDPLLHNRPGG